MAEPPASAASRTVTPAGGTDAQVSGGVRPATGRHRRADDDAARTGLIVLVGPPGSGRTTRLRALAEAGPGPVFAGGALASLRHVPGLALSRAVRARIPDKDVALAAEAVRARVRGGLLVLDDLQWADPLTLTVLPLVAEHCRVAVALRTPHSLHPAVEGRLRAVARQWDALRPLPADAAAGLIRKIAPALGPAAVDAVVARAGGSPLALRVLARRAADRAARGKPVDAGETGGAASDQDGLEHAVADALADLTRPARTAVAALGLLGRPVPERLLGQGVEELVGVGLATRTAEGEPGSAPVVAATAPYVAEIAAGLLDPDARRALHARLGTLLDSDGDLGGAARHLAAAGDAAGAVRRALAAADAATTAGEQAAHLLLAAGIGTDLDTDTVTDEVRLRAAGAALAAGRARGSLRALEHCRPVSVPARVAVAVCRAEALLLAGSAAEALAAARGVEPEVAALTGSVHRALRAEHTRVLLLSAVAADPALAKTLADMAVRNSRGSDPAPVRAALAAVGATVGVSGWEQRLQDAAGAARRAGRLPDEWWCRWMLVERLAADGRLADAAEHAEEAAARCAEQDAYSWETRFRAVGLWAGALRGADLDTVVRTAVDLLDRTVPPQARAYLLAAGCLALADTGVLAQARARLDAASRSGRPTGSELADAALAWVDREVAWLDGQPERALTAGDAGAAAVADRAPLPGGLVRLTGRWAAHDLARGAPREPTGPMASVLGGLVEHPEDPEPVRATLRAWQFADPGALSGAAATWAGSALREQVRCLLAAGLTAQDAVQGVPPLLQAEQEADRSGLVVLLGRVRRGLRRFAVSRDDRTGGVETSTGPQRGPGLSQREMQVLALVAEGEPTRRIAGLLGISRETVETHVRAGMRKLGARTRTEAAALAAALPGAADGSTSAGERS